MLCRPASLPPWTTSTLNTPSGSRNRAFRGVSPSSVHAVFIDSSCISLRSEWGRWWTSRQRLTEPSTPAWRSDKFAVSYVTYVLHSSIYENTQTPSHSCVRCFLRYKANKMTRHLNLNTVTFSIGLELLKASVHSNYNKTYSFTADSQILAWAFIYLSGRDFKLCLFPTGRKLKTSSMFTWCHYNSVSCLFPWSLFHHYNALSSFPLCLF